MQKASTKLFYILTILLNRRYNKSPLKEKRGEGGRVEIGKNAGGFSQKHLKRRRRGWGGERGGRRER